MGKESMKHEIIQAIQAVHQKIEDKRRKRIEQGEYEGVAIAAYKNIGEFIDKLRSQYLTKDGSEMDVTIETGVPSEWEVLPRTAADFLGKMNAPGTPEMLKIHAYKVVGENTRIMEFTIRKATQQEDKCRLVRVTATSMKEDRNVNLLFDPKSSLDEAPKPIADAYKFGILLQADGDFRHKMLVAASELVRFGGREAVKAIRARH